jgi:hypothetical protein
MSSRRKARIEPSADIPIAAKAQLTPDLAES